MQVKQISDNEIYMLIKYIKSVLWRVAKCLSYIEEARCLKVKQQIFVTHRCTILEETGKTWPTSTDQNLNMLYFKINTRNSSLFVETNNVKKGVFVNQPSVSMEMPFWWTVRLAKICRCMSDIINIYLKIGRGVWMGIFCLIVGTVLNSVMEIWYLFDHTSLPISDINTN